MAKLRRDMFDWFYDGIEIFGYDKKGRDELEEQEKFDWSIGAMKTWGDKWKVKIQDLTPFYRPHFTIAAFRFSGAKWLYSRKDAHESAGLLLGAFYAPHPLCVLWSKRRMVPAARNSGVYERERAPDQRFDRRENRNKHYRSSQIGRGSHPNAGIFIGDAPLEARGERR